jgi:antitoxin ParD1/3/4/toxin ParE1/3/4
LRLRRRAIWFKSGDTSKGKGTLEMADRIESVIRERFVFLSKNPGSGHWRKDFTDEPVKFFPVYSYLVVYRPETEPLQIVGILHGRRDVESVLQQRPS